MKISNTHLIEERQYGKIHICIRRWIFSKFVTGTKNTDPNIIKYTHTAKQN